MEEMNAKPNKVVLKEEVGWKKQYFKIDNNDSFDDDDDEIDKVYLAPPKREWKTHSLDGSPRSPNNVYWLSNALEVASSIVEMDWKLRMREASPHNKFAMPMSSCLRKQNSWSTRRNWMDMYMPEENKIKEWTT